ncbi:MAG: Stp1/IreP family PP2C-type Ser/Thr phosphatase [Actinomycetota bacterium]|nr:Stp1/IreP family PP2C-type Ser/Thr phosphatase [Actinomycetota bacterium]
MTVVRSGSATDVGRVRSVNEDRLLESVALFAVADGMGGHAGGEVASRLAIDALQQAFAREPSARGLVEAVRLANRAVWERSTQDPDVRGMGTTLTAAALVPTRDGDRLVVSNVGDSRAYRYASGRLVQMTHDHSVAEELVARGELSVAEAAVHPHRHILTRALGVAPDVDVDSWELAPARGERFVLCSDGLTNEVSEERIAGVLAATSDPQAAADTLVRLANEHGGNDNVTVVVVDVVAADPGWTTGPDGVQAARPGGSVVGVVAAGGSAVAQAGAAAGHHPGASGTSAPAPIAGVAHPGAPTAVVRAGSDTAVAVELGSAGAGSVLAAATGARTGPGAPAGHGDLRQSSEGSAATGTETDTMARHVAGALSDVMGRRSRWDGGVRNRVRSRRLTIRVVLFLILVAAVGAGAWALIRFYAEGAYYVGLSDGQVVVYQGRPGGFLGFEPRVIDVSSLTGAEVLSYRLPELRAGVQESSRQAAAQFVANLRSEACAVHPTAPACTSSGASGSGSTGSGVATVPGASPSATGSTGGSAVGASAARSSGAPGMADQRLPVLVATVEAPVPPARAGAPELAARAGALLATGGVG